MLTIFKGLMTDGFMFVLITSSIHHIRIFIHKDLLNALAKKIQLHYRNYIVYYLLHIDKIGKVK